MVTIVLTRGSKYIHNGIEFNNGEPVSVEFEVAKHLLELGSFAEYSTPVDGDFIENLLNSDAIGSAPTYHYVEKPLNSLNNDDLNDKRILFRRRGGIGDHVFAAALAAEIKRQFPASYICIAVQPESIPFVECFDAFDEVCTVDESSRFKKLHSFDYVLPLGGVLGSEDPKSLDDKDYFAAHWGRVGLHTEIPDPLPPLSILKQVSNLSVQSAATEVLLKVRFNDEPYVVLLLGTSNPLKKLTRNTLEEVAGRLSSTKSRRSGDPRLRVLCLSGETDRVFDPPNPWVAVRTDTTVPVAAELIRRSTCVVGADTGLMQYASAIGVPTVSCWGPTEPKFSIEHFSGPHRLVWSATRDAMECIPCMRLRTSFCPYFNSGYTKCMRGADVGEVVTGTYELVSENPEHVAKGLTVEEAMRSTKSYSDRFRVAVLLDHATSFTGGGFYTWSLAKMLSNLPNAAVTVFTDAKPSEFVYAIGDAIPPNKQLTVLHHENLSEGWSTDLDFDLVIGTPPFTGVHATKHAKSTGVHTCLLVYETPNYIAEYRDGLDSEEPYWAAYKEALLDCDLIVPISKTVKLALQEWLPRRKTASVLYPVINTAVADAVIGDDLGFCDKKTDTVVMIARNMPYKGLRSALKIIAEDFANARPRPVEIVVIGQDTSKLEKGVLKDVWKNCEIEFMENATEHAKWLVLKRAKAVVHPSDFEGFGIPVAEGLYAGAQVIAHPLPVFTEECFAGMIRTFTDEASLLSELNATFDEWDAVYDREEDVAYADNGEYIAARERRTFVSGRYTPLSMSPHVAKAFKPFTDRHSAEYLRRSGGMEVCGCDPSIRLAMISPWNTRCGIAETTKDLITNLRYPYKVFSYTDIQPISEDDGDVVRCWNRTFSNYYSLVQQIRDFSPNVVHIQHEHSLFQDRENFFRFLSDIRALGMRIVVTTHTYSPDRFTDELNEHADVIILTKEIEEAPSRAVPVHLPVVPTTPSRPRDVILHELSIDPGTFVVGSFGMWQEHKGFDGFMGTYNDVAARVPADTKVTYLVFGHCPHKSEYYGQVRRKYVDLIRQGHIRIHNEYLPIDEVVSRLAACDALVFNYSVAHHISASAAIRTGMTSGAPIICTTSPMFMEFEDGKHVLKVQFGDHEALVEALLRLQSDTALGENLSLECADYVSQHSPEQVAKVYESLYRYAVFGDEEEEV